MNHFKIRTTLTAAGLGLLSSHSNLVEPWPNVVTAPALPPKG